MQERWQQLDPFCDNYQDLGVTPPSIGGHWGERANAAKARYDAVCLLTSLGVIRSWQRNSGWLASWRSYAPSTETRHQTQRAEKGRSI